MNKCKKICLSILATVLCFAMLLIVPMVTKAGTEPTIVVSDAEASAGQEVSVTISLKNNPGIASMALYVEYDTTALTLKAVKDTGLLSGQVHPSSMEVYPYALTWENDSINENITVNGNIVTLTFDVADNITTKKVVDISVSYDNSEYDIYDVDLKTVDFAVDNGTVTIDKMPTPVALENGSVAIQSFGVDKSGDVPVAKASAYEDYLFAGWFTSAECTMDNVITDASKVTSDSYAKFIPAGVLGIKAQVANDGSSVMRFISSVDCLTYKSVGFEVTQGSTKKSYQTSTVYERIQSNTNGVEYGFSSKVVDIASNYLVTAKLQAEENKDYTVRVYVVTMDGQKVYGPSRCLGLLDGEDTNKINVVYKSENAPAVGSIIDVTYGKDNTATKAEVLAVDGKDVSVRVNVTTTLPSATKFTFGSTGSAIYRNLYTKYTGTGTADTTWYDVYLAADSSETEFTIATNADMYGFMNLYAGKNLFKNKTLYVISDIAMNDNVTKATVESWANGTEAPYKWDPSGDDASGTRFQGTFDGQMHKLSGFYVNEVGIYAGMFGSIDLGSVIKNFYLEDSYFTNVGSKLSGGGDILFTYLGSVAGENRGTVSNIYSNAIVATTGERTGGIIGVHNTTSAVATAGKQAIVDNCWFDGEVRLLGETGKVGGGIVGMVQQRESTMSNLLFTGKVTAETTGAADIGGIIGRENNASTINMEDCISVGTVTAPEGATGVGGAIGKVAQANSVHYMTNVYADSSIGALVGDGTADYPGLAVEKATLYGTTAYQKTLLDYDGTWCARTNATPVLRTFTEKYNANDVVTDFSKLERNQWYNGSMKAYGIHDLSAFKAFRDYANKTTKFSGMYVCLLDDINVNPGWTAPKTVDEAVKGTPENWVPIGNSSSREYNGIFDGKEHEVSGVYVSVDAHYAALFGQCYNAKIKNLKVTNSYFKQTGNGNAWAASVVGVMYGTLTNSQLTNVYSNAVIVTQGYQTGGIAGRAESVISQCWFDGEIVSTRSNAYVGLGGIVGVSRHKSGITITDCLNTGKVIYRATSTTAANVGVGGIYGWVESSSSLGVTIKNCINAGTVEVGNFGGVGAIAGYIPGLPSGYTYTVENCYAREDSISSKTITATSGILGGAASSLTGSCTGHTVMSFNDMKGAGSTVYTNLDFANTWTQRTNDVPVPTVFIDWIVPAN